MAGTLYAAVDKVDPGFAFEIEAGGDASVVGAEPCAALDFVPLEP